LENKEVPQERLTEGVYADDDMDKANMLNNYFSKCFSTSLSPLSVSPEHTEHLEMSKENPENLPPLSGSPENMHVEHLKLPEGSPENLLCTEDEVMYLLQTIDVSKASGAPVTKLFNQSILTGCFPMMWKRSNIVPIPKNGDKTNPANYKPISLLPILSYFWRGIL